MPFLLAIRTTLSGGTDRPAQRGREVVPVWSHPHAVAPPKPFTMTRRKAHHLAHGRREALASRARRPGWEDRKWLKSFIPSGFPLGQRLQRLAKRLPQSCQDRFVPDPAGWPAADTSSPVQACKPTALGIAQPSDLAARPGTRLEPLWPSPSPLGALRRWAWCSCTRPRASGQSSGHMLGRTGAQRRRQPPRVA